MNKKPEAHPLVAFHARMMDEYYRNWFSGGDAGEQERKKDAYHLLEHAGLLARLTGDDEILRLLGREPAEERRALVIAAFTAEDASEGHEKAAAAAGDDVETLEQAIIHRDTMDGVWSAGMEISWDFDRDEDAEMAEATDRFFIRAANLDQAMFEAHRPALCRAMRVMDAVRELVPDGDLWWIKEPGPMLAEWHRANRKPLIDAIMDELAGTAEEDVPVSGKMKPSKDPVVVYHQIDPNTSLAWRFGTSSTVMRRSFVSNPFSLLMAAASEMIVSYIFPKKGNNPQPHLTARFINEKEVWEFRLDEEGKFPVWAGGARLTLNEAGGRKICSAPFDECGLAEIPVEAVQTHLGTGGFLMIISGDGKPLCPKIRLASFKGH